MFEFIKRVFVVAMTFFSYNVLNVNSLECVMNNQECRARPKIINLNNNESAFCPFSNKVSKCSGSCNNINDPYAKLYIPDVIKNINLRVFNLIQRLNETRCIIWHEHSKSVCRLSAAICNSKQIWNDYMCRCECKEYLIDEGICDKGFIWNPSNCECECDNHVE